MTLYPSLPMAGLRRGYPLQRMTQISTIIRKDRSILIILPLSCMLAYLTIGLIWADAPAFDKKDVLFKADVSRVIDDMTDPDADHERTTVHPLFVLFLNPLGALGARFSTDRVFVAIVINSLFASLAVLLYYLILRGCSLNALYASLFSTVLAFSASHIVFSSIPETFIISTASLLLLLLVYLFFRHSRWFLFLFIPASIFSFGITSTNIVLCFILLFFAVATGSFRKTTLEALSSILLILVATSVAAWYQNRLYPTSSLFWEAFPYTEELNWVSSDMIHKPLNTLSEAAPVFFLYNVIAPELLLSNNNGKQTIAISRSPIRNIDLLTLM